MKRIISVLLAVLLLAALCACGKSADPKSFIDKEVSELVAAFGEPTSKEYGKSCLGDGEDGFWYYDDFTVYTYKEADSEVILDVDVPA